MTISATRFAGLLAFWFVLSARTDPLFIVMGVVAAGVVTVVARPLLDDVAGPRRPGLTSALRRLWGFVVFVAWLLTRIPPAAWQTSALVLRPSMPIRPHLVTFTTQLTSPLARTILANSISLVPGTDTVDVDGDRFVVHALMPTAADDVRSGALQNRIAAAFLDSYQQPPEMHWDPPLTGEEPR